jgi:ATP-dependent phosphofructokinase / diphosphate-dependent phosphofructokinase
MQAAFNMTTSSIKRIGILTGGGDCPGLNAVIRAVTKTAINHYNLQVFGIEDGFQGLYENRIVELASTQVSGILTRGGTILGTNNKFNPLRMFAGNDNAGQPTYRNCTAECLKHIQEHKIDGLVVVGGDGTMSCTIPFIDAGIKCVGVPKTIDNDLVGTDVTFGFTTAFTTATFALDRLHTTAASHHRVMVCEVMGRNAGWLALFAGIASGSDVILIPEIPFDIQRVCEFVEKRKRDRGGAGFSIVVVAEGAKPAGGKQIVARLDPTSPDPVRLGGIGECAAREIEKITGIETRTTVLGHVVRGGGPVPFDRVLATRFGHEALELLMDGSDVARMVVAREGKMSSVEIRNVANKQRLVPPDHPLIAAAQGVRTSFGT